MDKNYRFFIEPVTEKFEDGVEITTWKYDEDQTLWNFEAKYPMQLVKEEFAFETGAFLEGKMGELIDSIHSVEIKEGYLIISGSKTGK